MNENKKAQVTVFIIAGIVLLFTVSIGTYMIITKQETVPSETVIEDVPVQFQKVISYVDSCVVKVSTEAVQKVGANGGYSNLSEHNIRSDPQNPTESNAFRFYSGDKNSDIAYWRYFKSNNRCTENCECGSEMPYLRTEDGSPSIEEEIEKYIDANLKKCLNNFDSFKKQGYGIQENGELSSDVEIADDDIYIMINYPLDIKKGKSENEISKFFIRLPVDLEKIYGLAFQIMEQESNYYYLERWTQEQINGFGLGLNENALPPPTAIKLEPGARPVQWIKSDVKQLFIDHVISQYVQALAVFGTSNYIDNSGTFFERTTIPIASPIGESYYDLAVTFEFMNWWPIFFDITGRGVRGEVIGPEKSSFPLVDWIGLQRYNFYYDVSYPVKIDIFDTMALNNQGYHFIFGLESNVRDNKPLNCTNINQGLYMGRSSSLMCDVLQKCANIEISIFDAKTHEPVKDVLVSYGAREMCDLGITSEQGKLDAGLPQCVGSGCSFIFTKSGYETKTLVKAVRCDEENCGLEDVLCDGGSLELELEPKRTMKIVVEKKRMIKTPDGRWTFRNEPIGLDPNEEVMLFIEKKKENPFEDDLIINSYFNDSEPISEGEFVPGEYTGSLQLLYNLPNPERDKVVFNEVEICARELLDEECETIESIVFDSSYNFFPEGSIGLNFEIGPEDLDGYNTIVFYALSAPDKESFNNLDVYDAELIGKQYEFGETYSENLKPTYKNIN